MSLLSLHYINMKFLYLVLTLFLIALVHAAPSGEESHDDFDIIFYGKPYYEDQVGEIHGSVAPGEGAGSKRGNMTVASYETQKWLQVTLYDDYYYRGNHVTFLGPRKNIKPPFHVRSVKWKSLKNNLPK